MGGVTIWEIIWTGGWPHQSGFPHLSGLPHLHVDWTVGYPKEQWSRGFWEGLLAPPPLFPKKRLLWKVSLRPSHRKVIRLVPSKKHCPAFLPPSFVERMKEVGGGGEGRGAPSVVVWQIFNSSSVSIETRCTDTVIVSSGHYDWPAPWCTLHFVGNHCCRSCI